MLSSGERVWQSSARKSNENSEHGSGPNCDDTVPMEAPREDVEMESDEDEEPWEAEVPRARVSANNPTSGEKQDHEDPHMLFTEVGVLRVSNFDYGFMTRNADTFPLLICRDSQGMVKMERRVANGKVPQHTSYHSL